MAVMGRPTKLSTDLVKKAWSYIIPVTEEDKPAWDNGYDVVPTVEGLALHIGISRDTAYEWEKNNDDFSDIMGTLKSMQGRMLIGGALGNKFNPTIAKLLLSSKHGYVEKNETDITSNGETVGQADPLIAAEFALFLKQQTEQAEEE